MSEEMLTGSEKISAFMGRGWKLILHWIREDGFPAVKIGGRWESDAELIRQWRKGQIEKGNLQE